MHYRTWHHLTLTALVAAGAGLATAHLVSASTHETTAAVQPCATEDSTGPCYWDAEHRGNGLGRSFTVDEAGHVTYGRTYPAECAGPDSAACIRLWQQPTYSYVYQDAQIIVPDGPALVDECQQETTEIAQDPNYLAECYTASLR